VEASVALLTKAFLGGVSSRNLSMTEERRQFEWQVMRHVDAAYNVARWYLRNDQDAEDAVQDSVLNAYKSFPKFKGADGKPWLLKIVRNRCLRHLDRQRKFPTVELDDNSGPTELFDPNDPESTLLRTIDAERVRAGIESLSDAYREVIVLREFEELSYSEIAEIIDIPIGTVMSRLARARAALASKLREEHMETPL